MDTTNTNTLTADQQTEADRIEDILRGAASVEIRRMAELLASKENGEHFGETESSRVRESVCSVVHRTVPRGRRRHRSSVVKKLRDILLGLGNRAFDAALSERNVSLTSR